MIHGVNNSLTCQYLILNDSTLAVENKCCYNKKNLLNFVWEKEDEDKRVVKPELFSKLPFSDMYQKKPARSLFGAWSFPLVHIQFTPSEEPKEFIKLFFKEVRPWKNAILHGPTSWSMV